jgi:C1A family cysteine protease
MRAVVIARIIFISVSSYSLARFLVGHHRRRNEDPSSIATTGTKSDDESSMSLYQRFSFEKYVQDFGKPHAKLSNNDLENNYAIRQKLFEKNFKKIQSRNRQYPIGGYVPNIRAHQQAEDLPFPLDHVNDLPSHVDWRTTRGQAGNSVVTPIKNQGGCGSCWAFATTAVLESHIAIRTGTLFELSMQQLVSCMNNTQDCGGDGGCTGATSELAFAFVQQYGMVPEWNFGYQSYHGEQVSCTLSLRNETASISRSLWTVENDMESKTLYEEAVASIATYALLPRNNYTVCH